MNDTVRKLMALADDYADWFLAEGNEHPTYVRTRQALEAELTRLLAQQAAENEANERNLCQLTDELAESRREVAQLQEQNTALDAKLARQEAMMRQALEALNDCRDGCEEPHKTAAAINDLEDALK